MGKSKAQDKLMAELIDFYPAAFFDAEVYIGSLIEERGYAISEIQSELGHKPHKMFVDIVMRDADRTVAFEYHGEQHYSLVGNMTKTTADLLLNQQLDREKSWILERIGIPIVAVPFDMYIDESVIEHLIDEAYGQMNENLSSLSECPVCGRLFPQNKLPHGACKSCIEKEREQRDAERKQEQRRNARTRAQSKKSVSKKKSSWQDFSSDADEEELSYEEQMKEQAREYRRQKYQEWKNSPEYAAQKEEAKRRRKEAYQRQKAERKMRKRRGEE